MCFASPPIWQSIIDENHSGPMARHFSGECLYKALPRHWWWQNMYSDVVSHHVPSMLLSTPLGESTDLHCTQYLFPKL